MRGFVAQIFVYTWALTLGFSVNRTERDVTCVDVTQYQHGGICCLNCPAGTLVKQACSAAFTRGTCERCDYDSYTEHDNGLLKCLQCTKCHSDQEVVEKCTTTRNTECQCRPGSFCLPDHACEVCRLCSRCKDDEEQIENCTAHSDTVCQKKDSVSSSVLSEVLISLGILVVIVLVVGVIVVGVVGVLYPKTLAKWKRAVASCWPTGTVKVCKESGGGGSVEATQNRINSALEEREDDQPFLSVPQPVSDEEEDGGLGPSLPTTTASSQTSLPVCAQASDAGLATNQDSPPQLRNARENETLRRLVPVNDESLKRSFDLFGEIDVNYHKRFFRKLGLSDNRIHSTDHMLPEDRVYELLMVWMEKEGMDADFNHLIDVLIQELHQRLSAENIRARAVSWGYFR
ncbi:hematopoietic death receptor [Trichomycterus rosablanca]|uniref:hematopoietic death receptor n=1 Tax=Trichomycterus rosablanca TaxID=2290929 RepID=UPI002F3603C4